MTLETAPCTENTAQGPAPTITQLNYSVENVRTPEELREVRVRALDMLRESIRRHLDSGKTIRESLGICHCDWTREGSKVYKPQNSAAVTEHLLARFQGFGTSLQFLPDDRPRCGNLAA